MHFTRSGVWLSWTVEGVLTMPPIPDTALVRFRTLEARADDYQAALQSAYAEATHLRSEVARLKAALRHPLSGSQLEIDTDGRPLTYDRRLGRLVVLEDVGLAVTARNLHKAELDLQRTNTRTAELSSRYQMFRSLADRCRDALAEAGWREDDAGYIGGTGPAFPVPAGAVRLEGGQPA
jgi:hypothetical protein